MNIKYLLNLTLLLLCVDTYASDPAKKLYFQAIREAKLGNKEKAKKIFKQLSSKMGSNNSRLIQLKQKLEQTVGPINITGTTDPVINNPVNESTLILDTNRKFIKTIKNFSGVYRTPYVYTSVTGFKVDKEDNCKVLVNRYTLGRACYSDENCPNNEIDKKLNMQVIMSLDFNKTDFFVRKERKVWEGHQGTYNPGINSIYSPSKKKDNHMSLSFYLYRDNGYSHKDFHSLDSEAFILTTEESNIIKADERAENRRASALIELTEKQVKDLKTLFAEKNKNCNKLPYLELIDF